MIRSFRFIDLFAGLGGFHLAAQRLGGECVLASELQVHLQQLYEQNFGITPKGDINDIRAEDVPSHEMLCAGFPCQPFSKAGTQLGWKDAVRGTVFLRVVEILESRRPEYVVLENVAHFVRHDEGNTYARVCQALEELGYDVRSAQYSPHHFGVPQIRERMYLVARLKARGGLKRFKWPNKQEAALDISTVLDKNPAEARPLTKQVIDCLKVWQEFLELLPEETKLPSFPIWSQEFGATYPYHRNSLDGHTVKELNQYRGLYGTALQGRFRIQVYAKLPSYAQGTGLVFPKWKKDFIRQNREFYSANKAVLDKWIPKIRAFPPSLQKLEWNCQGEKRHIWEHIIQFRASGVRVKRRTTAPSLVAMTTTQVPIIGWERRYMTAQECARLQSMDELKYLPTAAGPAFKALGNAINVDVAATIIGALLSC